MASPSEILGLFTSPQQYQQQQQDLARSRAMEFAKLDPFQQANTAIGQGAYGLAGAIGGALGGQDPQLKMISQRQALANQLDPNDPASYMKVAQSAAQMGDQQFAILIADAGRKAQSEMALAQQRGVEKMTNEQRNALEYARQFGTPDSKAFKDAFKERFDQLTLKAGKENKPFEFEAKEARLQELKSSLRVLENQPVQNKEAIQRLKDSIQAIEGSEKQDIPKIGVSEATGEAVFYDRNQDLQFVKRKDPKDPTKQIRVPFEGRIDQTTSKVSASASSKGADEGAKTISELSAKRVDAAKVSAGKAMEQAGLLQELLKTPQPISGSGAPVRVGALRVFSTFGLTSPKDDEALGNADKFNALAGERVISFIKALGSNPTDTDREFARTIGPALEKGTKTNADLINFLLERARKVVKDADAIENYFYDNNYSLRGYKSPFMTDLETPKSMASDKPVSQMTRQELLDEEARLLGNKKP
jgi:hypothetical protein